jgi:hypothetical protein
MNNSIKQQLGQSTTEYLVVLIVVMVMFGAGVTGNPSVITEFTEAIRTAFERFSSFISLPI